MKQTRLESFCEQALSTLLGLVVVLVATPAILSAAGLSPSRGQNLFIVAAFTLVSLLRGYLVRRFFNAGLHRLAVSIARRIFNLWSPP